MEELTLQMEKAIETANVRPCFVLPGEDELTTWLHLARTTARTAERRLWALNRQDPVPETILQYINRLSDLLFVMARCELARQDWPEERWQAFAYKNQR